ncbi:MAG TPA: AgmX/PglI C-terminal domain-containing protein [Kofleriaceae bacterium]|nr:AgmX/PglI C-terminal domain-containing protein [Kofleriaceae bacterium]
MTKLVAFAIVIGSVGVVAAAPSGKATLSINEPKTNGPLAAKAVSPVIKRARTKLLACYAKALASTPALDGTQEVSFTITVDGKVIDVAATGIDPAVDACVSAAVAQLRFAKQSEVTHVGVFLDFSNGQPAQGGAFASLTGTGDISSGFDDTNIYGGLLGDDTTGTGGGWGTIGTGRYGTIGKGSGTGSGYGPGGMRGRTTAVPTVSIGQPVVSGELDKAIIRRYIKRNIQKLQYCYEKELFTHKTLQGTVMTDFTIGADGIVSASTATGIKNKNVETCIAGVVKGIEFPKPKTGEVRVNYPFVFHPASTAAPTPAPTPAPAPKP